MRILATGTPGEAGCDREGERHHMAAPATRRHIGGFTLLELLVVLVLVSILAGFAVLAVRGRDAQALVDEDAERLFALLTLAREDVLFRYRTIGVWLSQHGYRFFVHAEGDWQPSADPLFGERTLAAGVNFRLYLEGRPVVLDLDEEKESQEGDGADVSQDPLPQLVLFPDGEVTPFEIVVESSEAVERTLRGTPAGQLTLERDDVVD